MSISLPALPRLAAVTPRYLDFGGLLTPQLGGPEQRVLRLGSRLGADVTLPTLDADCAGKWLAARLAHLTTGATLILAMPQPHAGATGITGAGSLGGTTVTVSGGAPAVGQLFSFVAGGRNYLHMVTGVAGSTISVAPRLRAAVSGSLEFVAPKLEGFLTEGGVEWTIQRLRWIGQSFTLRENR